MMCLIWTTVITAMCMTDVQEAKDHNEHFSSTRVCTTLLSQFNTVQQTTMNISVPLVCVPLCFHSQALYSRPWWTFQFHSCVYNFAFTVQHCRATQLVCSSGLTGEYPCKDWSLKIVSIPVGTGEKIDHWRLSASLWELVKRLTTEDCQHPCGNWWTKCIDLSLCGKILFVSHVTMT